MHQVTFPTPPAALPPTPLAEIDAIVANLSTHKAEWPKVGLHERLTLLAAMRERILAKMHEWVALDAAAKGLAAGSAESGEAWLSGPVCSMRNVRLLEEALREMQTHGVPRVDPKQISKRPDGRLVIEVFPRDLSDKLLYGGMSAEMWMQPGVTAENLPETQAVHYKNPDPNGKVGLVLGAGNIACIPVMDSLYKLFVENEVVVLKMNPVNEYLGPIFREVFAPLVERGFFEVVYGGAEQGRHLANHAQVDSIHITGSDQTYDAIVWGPPEGRAERKAKGEKVNAKPITSELGNVTPLLVVPGKWTASEMKYQAEHVATLLANNASFNCNALKLIVTAEGWPQRQEFLDAVNKAIAATPARKAWYPGARARWQRFRDAHPEAVVLADGPDTTVPWTFIPGLDPEKDDICFREESFCGVVYDTALPGATAAEFLPRAVAFANDKLWGTLACVLFVDPRTRKDPASEAAFQKALDDLRYGGIAVNCWPGLIFGLTNTAWGAYPGHTPEDIQSGNGMVHNMFMFEKAQKAILSAPFVMSPKPAWFVTHGRTHKVAERMVHMEAAPSLLKVPGIAINALLG